jgi:hypothetical protein
MNYQNSWFYRIVAGSWLLGWLLTTPDQERNWYSTSFFYNLGRKTTRLLSTWLGLPGRYLDEYAKGSLIISNLSGVLVIIISLYLAQDLIFNDYSWYRETLESALLIISLVTWLSRRSQSIWDREHVLPYPFMVD